MSVTPADSDINFTADTDLSDVQAPSRFPRGLSFAVAGTIKITTMDGSILTYVSGEIATGVIHPISIKRIWSTGTTATNFKIYW